MKHDEPRDVVRFLGAVYHHTRALLDSTYTNGETTKLLRLVGLGLLVVLCGPLAWAGVGSVPGVLVVLAAVGIGLRIVVFWWRRSAR